MKAMTHAAKWLAILLAIHTTLMASGLLMAQEGGLFSFLTPNRNKTANKLKMLALAMHNYHDVYKRFPPNGQIHPDPKEETAKVQHMLSWRVRILPFIEHQRLYDQFNFNEPWDGPTNKPLLNQMPDIFKPAGVKMEDPTKTVFLAVTLDSNAQRFAKAASAANPPLRATSTCFDNIVRGMRPPGLLCQRIANCIDGTSNTIMIVEADVSKAVPWTKPQDLEVNFADPWKGLGTLRNGGFNFAYADGSVASLEKASTDAKALLYGLICNDGMTNELQRKGVR